MRITNIYKNYDIPPILQVHMQRVTAVALIICENLSEISNDEKENVAKACLLHDIGNIIKFNLDYYPDLLQPEGKEYWQKVKDRFIEKYGNEEHKASEKIAQEIGVSKKVISLINAIGFPYGQIVFEKGDFLEMICCYSDQRVTPFGVSSLKDRVADGLDRIMKNHNLTNKDEMIKTNKFYGAYFEKMEKKIFENCRIQPAEINDESISSYMNNLNEFEV